LPKARAAPRAYHFKGFRRKTSLGGLQILGSLYITVYIIYRTVKKPAGTRYTEQKNGSIWTINGYKHAGTRKGYPGLVIFDVNFKCFAGEIPLHAQGTMKFLFSLKCPSPQGGSAFVLVTEEQIYGQIRLHVFRLDLAGDGLSVANCRPLLSTPLSIGGEYICSMREDAPEIVVMANPGLRVWRINAMADAPQEPTASFTVQGADLTHFYDGFLSNGSRMRGIPKKSASCGYSLNSLLTTNFQTST
uniref:CUB domain-containing protein n=1 Tax=Heligmosomoides polygyrus TaxID=6339 RepID=A0A183GRI9_HELPZ